MAGCNIKDIVITAEDMAKFRRPERPDTSEKNTVKLLRERVAELSKNETTLLERVKILEEKIALISELMRLEIVHESGHHLAKADFGIRRTISLDVK